MCRVYSANCFPSYRSSTCCHISTNRVPSGNDVRSFQSISCSSGSSAGYSSNIFDRNESNNNNFNFSPSSTSEWFDSFFGAASDAISASSSSSNSHNAAEPSSPERPRTTPPSKPTQTDEDTGAVNVAAESKAANPSPSQSQAGHAATLSEIKHAIRDVKLSLHTYGINSNFSDYGAPNEEPDKAKKSKDVYKDVQGVKNYGIGDNMTDEIREQEALDEE